MTFGLFVDQIINGVVLGSMYSLYASGLTLIWGTMKLMNFAHGEYYMLGGYFVYFGVTLLGAPPVLSILITIGATFLIGLVTERLIIQPLLDKPTWETSSLVVTVGLSIFLQNFALKVWGERLKGIPYFIGGTLEIFGVRVAYHRLLILAVAILVLSLLLVLIKKTRFGMALRATAQEKNAAIMLGINFYRIYMVTFAASGAMAAVAATMLAPIFLISPWSGISCILKAFVVAVLGGLGSVEGAILGGIVLGIAENLSVIIFSSEWKDVVSFGILILVLTFRPSGFFGQKEW
ncbi:MAG: branched-chain amino acid ABC transporter permease [Thermodesulfobacteriota bacterium]